APKQSPPPSWWRRLLRFARNDLSFALLRDNFAERPHRRHVRDPIHARRTKVPLERRHGLLGRGVIHAGFRDPIAEVADRTLQLRALPADTARLEHRARDDRPRLDRKPDPRRCEARPRKHLAGIASRPCRRSIRWTSPARA